MSPLRHPLQCIPLLCTGMVVKLVWEQVGENWGGGGGGGERRAAFKEDWEEDEGGR